MTETVKGNVMINIPQAPSISVVPATHSHTSPAPHSVFGIVHSVELPRHTSPRPPTTIRFNEKISSEVIKTSFGEKSTVIDRL